MKWDEASTALSALREDTGRIIADQQRTILGLQQEQKLADDNARTVMEPVMKANTELRCGPVPYLDP